MDPILMCLLVKVLHTSGVVLCTGPTCSALFVVYCLVHLFCFEIRRHVYFKACLCWAWPNMDYFEMLIFPN